MSAFSHGFHPVFEGPRRPLFFIFVLASLSFFAGFFFHALVPLPGASIPVQTASVRPVFSPGQSEPELLGLIGSAQRSIDVMLYEFSYAPLSQALGAAQARGIPVRVLLDPDIGSNLYMAETLVKSGVSVRWASKQYSATHAKFMVVDGKTVFVGSTNWSRHAMQLNREAAVSIENPAVAKSFDDVFESDWSIGETWKP